MRKSILIGVVALTGWQSAARAAAPDDAAAQCQRILDKAWQAMQPAIAKLQMPDPAALQKEVTASGYESKKFLQKCPAAPRAYRDCIEAAANPLHFIRPCQASQPEPKPEELPIPKMPNKSPLLKPAPLGRGAGVKLLARLAGTWQATTPFETETWTVAKNGQVEVTRVRGGQPVAKGRLDSFKLSFADAGHVTVHYPGNDQTRSFFMADDGATFYSSGNLMWSVYPIGDGKKFVAINGFDWILKDGEGCEVVTYLGSVVPATCGFADRKGGRFFDVSYQVPGEVQWGTTTPQPTTASFPVFGTDLLAADLVKQQAFVRTGR